MKLKFHADDFGLNENVNTAVLHHLNNSTLESVSILVNFPSLLPALKVIKKFPKIPVFLHLNLIEGKPISALEEISTLVENNLFLPRNTLLSKLFQKTVDPEHVKKELTAQIHILQDHGIKIYGIDSHQHLHAFSPISEIVVQIAHKL
jgi:chitin disaccharide deacetylase